MMSLSSKPVNGAIRDDGEIIQNDSADAAESTPCGSEDDIINELQRVDSWPVHFRPTTATRLIHTSQSVLRNQPSKRRPLTTTALERRKPPPSTAASERSKAQEFSKRLLGPITLESKRPNNDVFNVPNSLASNEWENELARNIINVFSNKSRSDIKGESSSNTEQVLPPMIANSSSLPSFSTESTFRGEQFMPDPEETRDFERISVSRAASFMSYTDTEFSAVASLENEFQPEAKKADNRNGTFSLKMIWFTGTGMAQANWEAINGE